jgi:hypothetical protein
MMLGEISTARKSPLPFGRLSAAVGVSLVAGRSREILPSNPFSISIMTAFR